MEGETEYPRPSVYKIRYCDVDEMSELFSSGRFKTGHLGMCKMGGENDELKKRLSLVHSNKFRN